MEHLTNESFKEKIFDYTAVNESNEIEYKNKRPVIIDFYADWCQPCKIVSPILEELSNEYKDKVDIYKIDTENEQMLSASFGIRSIPSFLFIPTEGQPQMAMGALPKSKFEEAIKEIFNI